MLTFSIAILCFSISILSLCRAFQIVKEMFGR